MSEQPRLFEPDTDPLTCEHAGLDAGVPNRVWCQRGEFWTNCRESVAGDPPHCAFDPFDNSPEACARRVAWFKEHK